MEKYLSILGWMAVAITLYMEVSYFYQVISDYGSFGFRFHFDTILFLMNNMLWVGHGFFKNKKDWPLIIANGFVIVMVLVQLVYSLVGGF